MPRKNKRKFFKINKKGNSKADEAETSADSSRKNVQTVPEENSITPTSTSVENAKAMGQHDVETSGDDTGSISTSKLEVFTLKVIQFVGELPKSSQIDVDSDESLKIESHIEKPQSETIDAPEIEAINEPHKSVHFENKHVVRAKDRIFDANYRVESPQNLEGYRNKRHAVMIQEVIELNSTDNVVNVASDVIDKPSVEKTVAIPLSYRVDSPENYSDSQQQVVVEHDSRITVQEIAESSSSESLKSESPKNEPNSEQSCLKIINIKELPSEDIVPSTEVRDYECNYKIEKKSLPNRDALADPYFSPMMCIPSPSRYLDVIAEESSDCSDIEKTTKPHKNILEEELDDDVFLDEKSDKPEIPRKPTSFKKRSHRQFFPEPAQHVIVEQPILISTKIIETENVPESVNKWSTSTGESELTAELVYLNSTSSSCTDLDSRSERSDITDCEDDNSEDTETNTMLDNLVLEEIDRPIEIKMSQNNRDEKIEKIENIPDIPEKSEIEHVDKDNENTLTVPSNVEEVVQVGCQVSEVMKFMDKLTSPKLSFAPKMYDQESLDEVDEIEEIDEVISEKPVEVDPKPETLVLEPPKNIENQFEDIEREFQNQMIHLKLENEQFRNKMQLQVIMDQEKIESKQDAQNLDQFPNTPKNSIEETPPEIPPRKLKMDKFEPIDIDLLIKIFEDQTSIEKAKRTKNLLSTIPVLEHQIQNKDKVPADKVCDYTKSTDKADAKLEEIEYGKPTEFPRKNSSDSSSSNSNCTIIRQIHTIPTIAVQPLKELCTDLIIKSGLQHESSSDEDLKCAMRRQKNAPKIPVIDEIEFSTCENNSEGRTVDNKSITVLQANSEATKNSTEKEHWFGIQSMQIPNLLVALSPLQNEYMTKTTDQAADADSLLDMHKKFIERRAYHEQEIDDYYTKSASMTSTVYTGIDRHDQRRAYSERTSVEKSTPIGAKKAKSSSPPAHERQFQLFHEAQGNANNNLRLINIFDEPDSQCYSELPENISSIFAENVAQINQISQISAIAADLNKQFVEAKLKACSGDETFKNSHTTPKLELAKVDHKMRTIKNYILRDEFFRETFAQKSGEVPQKPQTGVIAQKQSELQHELKLLEEERKKIEDELNYIQSLQHFKHEEIKFNQQKMQIIGHDRQMPTKLINSNQNSNEHLQREMHNEWQQQVMERNERKLQKLLKLTSVDSENNSNSAEKPLEIVKIVPIENEFLRKVRERRKRLSIPADSDLNSSTESLHHLNQAKPKKPAKKVETKDNLPMHLQEFIEFYDETDKNGEKSGEFKDPFVIGLICCVCVAGLCIGSYYLTRSH